MKFAFLSLLAGILFIGCTSTPTVYYPSSGGNAPRSEFARIKQNTLNSNGSDTEIFVSHVDGDNVGNNGMRKKDVCIAPGTHIVTIVFDGKLYSNYSWNQMMLTEQSADCTIPVDAKAGHVYIIEYKVNNNDTVEFFLTDITEDL